MAPLQTTEDYYAILEVQLTTDDANIKASYERLARLKHPDKDLGNPNATVNFQMVSFRTEMVSIVLTTLPF